MLLNIFNNLVKFPCRRRKRSLIAKICAHFCENFITNVICFQEIAKSNKEKKDLGPRYGSNTESEIESSNSQALDYRNDDEDWVEADDTDNIADSQSNSRAEIPVHDEAVTVNPDPHNRAVPSFEEAMKYIDLLSSYCNDNAPAGMNHLWPLKTMLQQLELEKSRRALEKLRAKVSARDKRESIQDECKSARCERKSAASPMELETAGSTRVERQSMERKFSRNERQPSAVPVELENL